MSDRECSRAAWALQKARGDRRLGKDGPWGDDPNSEEEDRSNSDSNSKSNLYKPK
jgi:hypothetical protein